MLTVRFIFFSFLFTGIHSWYTCEDKPFCQRIRNKIYGDTPYYLNTDSISIEETNFDINLINADDGKVLKLTFSAISGGIFRILFDDEANLRHSVPEALVDEIEFIPMSVEYNEDVIIVTAGETSAVLNVKRFKIDIYNGGELINEINSEGKLIFNHESDDESIALDFKFPGAQRAYGIPLHAERLSLRTTTENLNPYRLFNVDHCCYAVDSQDPLYGAVPVLYAHGTVKSSGIFWLNSAQTFVDITNGNDHVAAHFISETGVLDLFILTGPSLQDAARQYTKITGTAPLPPYFSIAHHQSRYSYRSQRDLLNVVEEFDNHEFPVDVMWLDIDYTDSYKYFTWNYIRFPQPEVMQNTLNETGRKLVVIIDPHVRVEESYFVFDIGKENGYFVMNPDGSLFKGECWPGLSSYWDFHNPNALSWYSSLYHLENFPNSTEIMFIWNDMNEPSVFYLDELTMPGDLLHYGGWKHRDVHNMYGFMQTKGTWIGMMDRMNHRQRPFILTRSHFAGSQRYAAIWTGDNLATWEHLQVSFPMCLSEALAGISFCGADIGGFVTDVETELLERWYQAGAWLPFYRQHSTTNINRREPYLYEPEVQAIFRKALRSRYSHLPYWYTIWYEHERFGDPVIRPIIYHYPADTNALDIDDQWLVGKDILVHPVAEKSATAVRLYFPGGPNQLWFDIDKQRTYRGNGYEIISVTADYTPVFYRGGSIIVRKDLNRPSSALMHQDPFSIYVFLDDNNTAVGNVYCDDNTSFDYRTSKKYVYYQFTYANNSLSGRKIDEDADFDCLSAIATVHVYNGLHFDRKIHVSGLNIRIDNHFVIYV